MRRSLVFPGRRLPSFSWAAIVLSTMMMPGLGGPAHGQRAIQAAIERAGPVSPDKRAELYRELRVQAEFLERQSAVIRTVARLVGPTVVFVEADASHRATNPGARLRRVEEAGSGVVIAFGGKHYILTSRHVVAGTPPESIKITLADGRRLHPTRIWDDIETDVAVMAVSAPDLVAAALGDSDRMEIGDFVLAVGSPFGLSNSVTFGIISAKGRRDLDLGDSGVRLQDFLQTDAAINPGNSGGPLVNLRGEVIGINTAIASRSGANEGIGFAIPINMFMVVARQLIEHGKVSRAFLGVTLDPAYGPVLAAELGLPRPAGARVNQVAENSPAAAAKIEVGDVILEFNGVPVENDAHLVNMVNLTPVGKQVEVVVYRQGRTEVVRVVVGERR
ncbi:MAG: trypsin-like peptidase domain-containing protein [Thermoguttaceae bacterium]|nr:trypsin-like peptidase domain-containing protein [Thermoguttaceae bacterium]